MAYGALTPELQCECGKTLTRMQDGDMKCFSCGRKYNFEIKLEEKN